MLKAAVQSISHTEIEGQSRVEPPMVLTERRVAVDREVCVGISKCLLKVGRSVCHDVSQGAEEIESGETVSRSGAQMDTVDAYTSLEQMLATGSGKRVA